MGNLENTDPVPTRGDQATSDPLNVEFEGGRNLASDEPSTPRTVLIKASPSGISQEYSVGPLNHTCRLILTSKQEGEGDFLYVLGSLTSSLSVLARPQNPLNGEQDIREFRENSLAAICLTALIDNLDNFIQRRFPGSGDSGRTLNVSMAFSGAETKSFELTGPANRLDELHEELIKGLHLLSLRAQGVLFHQNFQSFSELPSDRPALRQVGDRYVMKGRLHWGVGPIVNPATGEVLFTAEPRVAIHEEPLFENGKLSVPGSFTIGYPPIDDLRNSLSIDEFNEYCIAHYYNEKPSAQPNAAPTPTPEIFELLDDVADIEPRRSIADVFLNAHDIVEDPSTFPKLDQKGRLIGERWAKCLVVDPETGDSLGEGYPYPKREGDTLMIGFATTAREAGSLRCSGKLFDDLVYGAEREENRRLQELALKEKAEKEEVERESGERAARHTKIREEIELELIDITDAIQKRVIGGVSRLQISSNHDEIVWDYGFGIADRLAAGFRDPVLGRLLVKEARNFEEQNKELGSIDALVDFFNHWTVCKVLQHHEDPQVGESAGRALVSLEKAFNYQVDRSFGQLLRLTCKPLFDISRLIARFGLPDMHVEIAAVKPPTKMP